MFTYSTAQLKMAKGIQMKFSLFSCEECVDRRIYSLSKHYMQGVEPNTKVDPCAIFKKLEI